MDSMISLGSWSALLGLVMPYLTALFIKEKFTPVMQAWTGFLLCVLVSVIEIHFSRMPLESWPMALITIWSSSMITYNNFWKHMSTVPFTPGWIETHINK